MAASLFDFDTKLSSAYKSALESGELIFTASETFKSSETEFEVDFEICYAPALAKKPQGIPPVVDAEANPNSTNVAGTPSTPVVKKIEKANPFLPHSPALFITDASEEHKILLNKFCIVPRHFLVVTKGKERGE